MRRERPSGTATVLFTDLVGSTDLLSRLGEAVFDEVRRGHFATLREALTRHGGEEVKTLGDGVLAVFGSAADAVSSAVAIQQAVDRRSRSGSAPLSVRVGLALGDVSFEEDDVFGTPVVEAARLVAAAKPGQILATAIVRAVAGSRSSASFCDRGLLELKGLPEPVPTCEVAWEPVGGESIPMPALLTDLGRIFVGREAEFERLTQLWKEAAAGDRRVAFLAGEPGVGKTRLAAELAVQVHEEGATVLAGRCDEDLGVPYQPFVEALRHFADHTPGEELAARLGRYGGELARLVPELTESVPDLPAPLKSDPETERYRLFDAVAAWLAAVSADQAVVLVLDDLQWAAKPTMLLLRHVVRSAEPARLLILGTYRDTELASNHPLVEVLADLRRQSGVERLSVTGLDSSQVANFMEQAAGHALRDEDLTLARAIHEETEGNPFFVREVLRHLAETGALERLEGRWTARLAVEEVGIPEGVREVVERRLSRLSREANDLLRLSAVVGAEFELSVLLAASEGFDEEDLVSALEEAAGARLITEVQGGAARYRFAHALVRDTLYGALSIGRRVTLHRRIGEAIEAVHVADLNDHLPALAHHWAHASAPAPAVSKAVEYARRAGDRALAQLAHDEAVEYYRSALELLGLNEEPPDDARRLQLLISLGEAERRAGDPAHRAHLLDAVRLAEKLGDAESMARAALATCRGSFSSAGTVDPEQVASIERALHAVGDGHDALKARLLAHLAMELIWVADFDRRMELSDEALALARRVGDLDVLAFVLTARTSAIWDLSTVHERLDLAAEALAIAERTGDLQTTYWGLLRRWIALVEVGDLEEADRHLIDLQHLAGELGQPFPRSLAMFVRATRFLMAGNLAEAEKVSRQGFAFGQQGGQADAPLFFTTQLFNIRYEQGRWDDDIGAQLAIAAERVSVPLFPAMLALHHCETGRIGEAASIFESVAAHDFRDVPRDNAWSPTMAVVATVCAHLEDARRAAALYELLVPYEHLTISHTLVWFGAIAHHLGILDLTLGRLDDAHARFAAAEATHERLGTPVSLARTRLEWARMLLTRCQPGDAERARQLLGQALATARELGLGGVERRAVGLLVPTTPSSQTRSGGAGASVGAEPREPVDPG